MHSVLYFSCVNLLTCVRSWLPRMQCALVTKKSFLPVLLPPLSVFRCPCEAFLPLIRLMDDTLMQYVHFVFLYKLLIMIY